MFLYVLKCIINIFLKLSEHSSLVHELFFDSRDRRRTLKLFTAFVYGLLVGFIFYKFILFNLGFPVDWKFHVGAITCLLCALGCSFSIQFRCVTALIWLGAFGKVGRRMIAAYVFTLMLTGPINNVLMNSKEVLRCVTCSSYLAYNLSRTKFDLMVMPFTKALVQMHDYNVQSIDKVARPIFREVEDQDNAIIKSPKYYETKYEEKLRKRCLTAMKSGSKNCERAFERAFESCVAKAPSVISYIVCSPLKIDFMCGLANANLHGIDSNICDPSKVIDSDFGNEYVRLREMERKFASRNNIQINYTTTNPEEFHAFRSVNDTGRAIIQTFEKKAQLLNHFINFIHKLLLLISFKIIYGT